MDRKGSAIRKHSLPTQESPDDRKVHLNSKNTTELVQRKSPDVTKLHIQNPSTMQKTYPVSPPKTVETVQRRPSDESKLLKQRHELKYRIPEVLACRIRDYIQDYIEPDIYAAHLPNYEYLISSLYLDSRKLDLYTDTLTGKCNRYKLRIRSYTDDPDAMVYCEIKRRINRVINKSRAAIPKTAIKAILEGQNSLESFINPVPQSLHQFQCYCTMLQAIPIANIRYRREAYEGTDKHRVRITFDRQLSYKETRRPEVVLNGSGWQEVPLGFVILEIKFTNQYPAWLSNMVQMFNLNLSSMSKYASSLKCCNNEKIRRFMPYYLD